MLRSSWAPCRRSKLTGGNNAFGRRHGPTDVGVALGGQTFEMSCQWIHEGIPLPQWPRGSCRGLYLRAVGYGIGSILAWHGTPPRPDVRGPNTVVLVLGGGGETDPLRVDTGGTRGGGADPALQLGEIYWPGYRSHGCTRYWTPTGGKLEYAAFQTWIR